MCRRFKWPPRQGGEARNEVESSKIATPPPPPQNSPPIPKKPKEDTTHISQQPAEKQLETAI